MVPRPREALDQVFSGRLTGWIFPLWPGVWNPCPAGASRSVVGWYLSSYAAKAGCSGNVGHLSGYDLFYSGKTDNPDDRECREIGGGPVFVWSDCRKDSLEYISPYFSLFNGFPIILKMWLVLDKTKDSSIPISVSSLWTSWLHGMGRVVVS